MRTPFKINLSDLRLPKLKPPLYKHYHHSQVEDLTDSERTSSLTETDRLTSTLSADDALVQNMIKDILPLLQDYKLPLAVPGLE